MPRYFRRRWDETRGDSYDGWGASTWSFEVDDSMHPVRHVEDYDSGPVLRYGPEHEEDEYGFLGYIPLGDHDEWARYEITAGEFECSRCAV